MQELIKIIEKEGVQAVSAKELYEFLELDKSHYSRWTKKCFTDNLFAEENIDYHLSPMWANGSTTIDFIITIDLAKKIGMMTKSVKGEEIRNYFIECEKQLIKIKEVVTTNFIIPQTLPEALRLYADEVEKSEKVIKLLEEAQPKIDFFNIAADATGKFDLQQFSAILKLPFGRTIAFRKLRELGYLQLNNVPYRKHIDNGLFEVNETYWTNDKTGVKTLTSKTFVTQKGMVYFSKVFLNIKK